ncbi:hypothetical protein GCM10018980_71860 [Streptomyces capoamus]|uniref:Uncharacterized protein n=1 Tax=Streptomyces capoamus TaxID=68183 RepID=A0A919KFX3_9ACTN|nr:hypothetical protein GCM10010501_16500 [Streptomyces libani subsp. rufus]GHG74780.1 hypothetical protein GCM10018980_71860 [Streptomyces capoamus]
MWGVNSNGDIYKFSGNDAGDPSPWVKIQGKAVDIGAAADGTVWHVNSEGHIYRYAGDQPG